MSLILDNSGNIFCKIMPNFNTGTGFFKNKFYVGDYEININDFNELILYYLTNTDLEAGDKRLELLEKIKKLHQVDGFNGGNKRLELKEFSFAEELAYNSLQSLKEELQECDFQHICKECNKIFYGTKVQSLCSDCYFKLENEILQKSVDKAQQFKKSMEISGEKFNRSFDI